jgi:hypothetical protein
MTTTAATLNSQFHQDLEDPAKYLKITDVPIFTTFKASRLNPDTGKTEPIDIDPEKIKAVVETQQKLERGTGGIPRITPGHTLKDPKTPEGKQPPPWGWSKSWRFSQFNGKPTIFGTLYFSKALTPDDSTGERKYVVPADDARTYPYRSPEYYDGEGEITGVALLRRDPQLDLGVLTYSRENNLGVLLHESNGVTYFAKGDVMAEESKEVKKEEKVADSMNPANPPQAAAPSPEDSEKFMACMKHHMPHLHALHEHMARGGHITQFGMSPMTPANAAVPAPEVPPPPHMPEAHHMAAVKEAVRMAREEDNLRFSRLEAQLAEERKLRTDAEGVAKRNKAEQVATQLQAEGFQFDRAEEVEHFAKIEESTWDARKTYIRKNFRQDLTRMPHVPVAPTQQDGKTGVKTKAGTEEDVKAVDRHRIDLMRQRGGKHVSFEEAEASLYAVK